MVLLRPKCLPRDPALRSSALVSPGIHKYRMSEYTINAILQVVQSAFAGYFARNRVVNHVSSGENTAVPDAKFFVFKYSF
jgi:hypothetical protein